MSEFTDELRSRINPQYVDQRGTESYERRLCVEEIEKLEATNNELLEALESIVNIGGIAVVAIASAAIARATKGDQT